MKKAYNNPDIKAIFVEPKHCLNTSEEIFHGTTGEDEGYAEGMDSDVVNGQ